MKEYYAQRAANYEVVYQRPERQAELAQLQEQITAMLTHKHVLEIACGTGYWTERLAPVTASVMATDINQSMLDIAVRKKYGTSNIEFCIADAFALPELPQASFDACFAGFWWSHVKKEEQTDFLTNLKARTGSACKLILIDNNHVEGATPPIARTDKEGNTYQLRDCENGQRTEIVKNYPSDSYLRKKFAPFAKDLRLYRNQYYWMLSCIFK